jgi:hypothetical protein
VAAGAPDRELGRSRGFPLSCRHARRRNDRRIARQGRRAACRMPDMRSLRAPSRRAPRHRTRAGLPIGRLVVQAHRRLSAKEASRRNVWRGHAGLGEPAVTNPRLRSTDPNEASQLKHTERCHNAPSTGWPQVGQKISQDLVALSNDINALSFICGGRGVRHLPLVLLGYFRLALFFPRIFPRPRWVGLPPGSNPNCDHIGIRTHQRRRGPIKAAAENPRTRRWPGVWARRCAQHDRRTIRPWPEHR